MNCPICNSDLDTPFQSCGKCDFEIMVIANSSSDNLKNYVLQRQERFKKIYQDKLDLKDRLKNITNPLIYQ
jgi:hypothetical protein